MTEPQPTQADREAAAAAVRAGLSHPDTFNILSGFHDQWHLVQALTRHASQAAAEREAHVIAGVVAYLREEGFHGQAHKIERGDWKEPSHAE